MSRNRKSEEPTKPESAFEHWLKKPGAREFREWWNEHPHSNSISAPEAFACDRYRTEWNKACEEFANDFRSDE